jgi:hypothetical protein
MRSYHFKILIDSPVFYYFKGTRACIIGHCSIIKTNNKKQQIFNNFLKELPVHKLCKSKNRAILFYFLQKQNDRSNDFETLSKILETLWESVRQCLTMSWDNEIIWVSVSLSQYISLRCLILSRCLDTVSQKRQIPERWVVTMRKPQSWHARMFCSHPMPACFHNEHCCGAASVKWDNRVKIWWEMSRGSQIFSTIYFGISLQGSIFLRRMVTIALQKTWYILTLHWELRGRIIFCLNLFCTQLYFVCEKA